MKKLINRPTDVVREMLEGLARQSPHVVILGDENVVVHREQNAATDRKVAVISGGGSGHEPAHGGYVGAGMLSAAVCGEVFTSPSTDAVLAAIHATAGSRGAVLIVKNYTGDRLNFGLAAELARAQGIPVEVVVVADDVSLRNQTAKDRRRGIAGTVFVHKVAGAAAALGLPLGEVASFARAVASNLGTMGVALNGCSIPGAAKSGFTLGDDEIELGLGIHGEKGVERTSLVSADALCEMLIASIVDDMALASGERVALLVNGLGATTQMELDVVLRAAYENLSARNIRIERAWAGTFLSALDMPGCSVSLLRVDDRALQLLDAPTEARAWPGAGTVNRDIRIDVAAPPSPTPAAAPNVSASRWTDTFKAALDSVSNALIESEPKLTELDSLAGDGDLGAGMMRAARAIRDVSDNDLGTPGGALAALSAALRRAIAGSSGPFYATALLRASRHLAEIDEPSPLDWAHAFREGVQAISDLGGAKAGDRTMLDALFPAVSAYEDALTGGSAVQEAWESAVSAAEQGALLTAQMTPRAGRASYLGTRAVGSPDAGAVAVCVWLAALTPHIAVADGK